MGPLLVTPQGLQNKQSSHPAKRYGVAALFCFLRLTGSFLPGAGRSGSGSGYRRPGHSARMRQWGSLRGPGSTSAESAVLFRLSHALFRRDDLPVVFLHQHLFIGDEEVGVADAGDSVTAAHILRHRTAIEHFGVCSSAAAAGFLRGKDPVLSGADGKDWSESRAFICVEAVRSRPDAARSDRI